VFDTELYRQFFGLTAPWKVAEVNRRRIDAAPRPRRRGRRPVQADQGPLAHLERERPSEATPRVAGASSDGPRVGRAWSIEKNLRHLWSCQVEGWAGRFFDGWHAWAVRSRLEPVKAVARMLAGRLGNVSTSSRHRITNAVAEGLESTIMAPERRAGGSRNPGNLKTVIDVPCGGLRLHSCRSRMDRIRDHGWGC